MNKNQWITFGIGLFIFGWFLTAFPGVCLMPNSELLTACYIRRYFFVIPGLISGFLGMIFIILGFLEPKKK